MSGGITKKELIDGRSPLAAALWPALYFAQASEEIRVFGSAKLLFGRMA